MFQLERDSSMEWVRGDVIGCGSFSTVSLAIPKKQSPQFPQTMAVKSAFAAQSDMLLREKLILEELGDCPQIIRCFGGDYSVEKGEKLYNLFLEYATGGTLGDKMKKQSDRRLPESEVRRYTRSILEGIKYIHENGYVHCDLKLENILLCSSSEDSPNDAVKIADFGLARRAGEMKERTRVELRGTPLYMSPEAVAEGVLGAPTDVWALGCMVVEMITGAPAWRCQPETGVLRLLMRIGVTDELPEIPGDLSPEGRDFVEKIFTKDPGNRWTAQMLSEHPFVAGQSCEKASPSTSPRGLFDWICDNETMQSPSITEISSSDFETWSSSRFDFGSDTSERLRKLAMCQGPDWDATDSWINVR